jgi:hypothetical protein
VRSAWRRFRLSVLVLGIASVSSALLAQSAAVPGPPPTREQVLKLISVMGLQTKVDAVLKVKQGKVMAGAHGCFVDMNPHASQETLEKLDAALAATPQVTFEDVADGLVSSAQRHLSAADVEAAIVFYSSEAGTRLRLQLPVILREANAGNAHVMMQKLRAYSDALNRTLVDFQNEMDQRKQRPPLGGGQGDSSQTMHTGSI